MQKPTGLAVVDEAECLLHQQSVQHKVTSGTINGTCAFAHGCTLELVIAMDTGRQYVGFKADGPGAAVVVLQYAGCDMPKWSVMVLAGRSWADVSRCDAMHAASCAPTHTM